MASIINTSKKSDCKTNCAYFDEKVLLIDEDLGEKGHERFICRNKRVNNPDSCRDCPFFSKEINLTDVAARAQMEAQPVLLELEDAILDMEVASEEKGKLEMIYEHKRRNVQRLVFDELKSSKATILNRSVTIAERHTDYWLEDKLRAMLMKVGRKIKQDLVSRVFKQHLWITLNSEADARKVIEFVAKLNAEEKAGIIVEPSHSIDEEVLSALIAGSIITREDLEGTYERKTSRWPLINEVVHEDTTDVVLI